MLLKFKGKNAIVAGACGGMGLKISEKLSKSRIKTLMLDIKKPPNNFLKKNKFLNFKKVDLINYSKVKKIIDSFYLKNKSIDYLVNTTGVLWFGKDCSSVDIDLNIWKKVFKINLETMVYLSKIIIPKMKKNKFGSMVHISSVDALSGDDRPQDAYGASKAAMIRLSKSLAVQFASFNIRSNVILPGPIDTPMQDRLGDPEDIANSIMFLLSDQSQYITGTEMIIDGGLSAKP